MSDHVAALCYQNARKTILEKLTKNPKKDLEIEQSLRALIVQEAEVPLRDETSIHQIRNFKEAYNLVSYLHETYSHALVKINGSRRAVEEFAAFDEDILGAIIPPSSRVKRFSLIQAERDLDGKLRRLTAVRDCIEKFPNYMHFSTVKNLPMRNREFLKKHPYLNPARAVQSPRDEDSLE